MEQKEKIKLAQKVMNEEVDLSQLSDDEVEEMISFLEQYIVVENQKLDKIKRHILKIRKNMNRR